MVSDQGPQNSFRQRVRYTPVVRLSFELHESDGMIWPNFEGNHLGVVKDLLLDDYLRKPSCCEGIIHLQTSMTSGFEPGPNGTAISVTNHSTRWVAHNMNILKTILHPEPIYIVSLQSGPSKPVLRMSFSDEYPEHRGTGF
ncbi:hypothetical protein TNCV_4132481 [Trichonephila clavipes]|nr:hypothetical protein TNCV_4132481 [Trichonephila clavipes]